MANKIESGFKSAPPRVLKENKIALQNIIFKTSERKLMVSDKFLCDMTKKYISKHIKEINSLTSYMQTTKFPDRFFKFSFKIQENLEQLIIIEPYFIFTKPVPSAFKKDFLTKLPDSISHFISKNWKIITTRHPLSENMSPEQLLPYDTFIEGMLHYRDELSLNDIILIEGYYKVIHGISYEDAHTTKPIVIPDEDSSLELSQDDLSEFDNSSSDENTDEELSDI